MSDIFICYSSKNRDVADRLLTRLLVEGWSVWMDTHTLTGTKWRNEIKKQLAQARTVVALWSAAAEDSDYVMDEAEDAKKRGILVPALIESMQLPYGFRQIQTASLIGWNGERDHAGVQQLVAALRVHLKKPEQEHTLHPLTNATARTADATIQSGNRQSTPTASPAAAAHHERTPGQVSMRLPTAGQTFRDKLRTGGEGPLMVVLPAGRFLMGSPPAEPERSDNEGPQHEVRIAQPFAMGVHAVTFDDYDRFCDSTGRDKPGDRGWGRANRPVIDVSCEDGQAYCAWLGEQTGRTYRLPSEAQWEYACRAGTTTPFHFGERIETGQANFNGNSTYNGSTKGEYRRTTVPVGSFAPNAFGLYDMHGNVWEWCEDAWHPNYSGAPKNGSAWEAVEEVARVVRGGSWYFVADFARSAARFDGSPAYRSDDVGFRVLCSSPIESPTAAALTTGPRKP